MWKSQYFPRASNLSSDTGPSADIIPLPPHRVLLFLPYTFVYKDLGMTAEIGSTRSALILYGSETGTAQEVAEELGRIAERLHFVTHVKECNSIKAVSVTILF